MLINYYINSCFKIEGDYKYINKVDESEDFIFVSFGLHKLNL